MIPVLYDELANLYTPPGSPTYWNVDPDAVKANIPLHKIGYLADAMSCKATEERNGPFELILTYPITGAYFGEIMPGRCIMAKAHPTGPDQLFRIYRTSKVLRGILTIYARHISYDLSGIDIVPIGLTPVTRTAAGWMRRYFQNTYFAGYSDITTTADPSAIGLMSIRMLLGGVEGSLLDTFGGEFTFDNFEIHLDTARGSNKGVVVEYGKNLTEMTMDLDYDNVYTGIRPCARYYNSNGDEMTAIAPEISTGITLGYEWTKILDVTETLGLDSGVTPTEAQLTAAANAWLADNPIGSVPTITVSFEDQALDIAGTPVPKAAIDLCDTVKVRYIRLGVSINQKVIRTVYNTLLERNESITLGASAPNLAGSVNDLESAVASIRKDKPIFTSGGRTVDLSDGRVNAIYGSSVSTLRGTGLTFNDGTTSTRLRGIKRTMDAADTTTITLEHGAYLAIVTHTNNSTTTQQGLYLIQCYTTSVITTIVAAAGSTLSISGETLTWTTTNTYRALRLILLT